ncbi:uncharacterized protein LOC127729645 [Mytilus californianus]|uniref:uncharacterized protein LOC127729645 n=1 Tax=Mytilus californianus TaxID=6549 RepID=UPI0022463A9D|nr:uncharacterized protein LOC127729645 [Mytilus californianus]
MASPLDEMTDQPKEDEHSLQNDTTEPESHMSQKGYDVFSSDTAENDQLLPQTEPDKEAEVEKPTAKSFLWNYMYNHATHDRSIEPQPENNSESDICNKSLRNVNESEASLVTVHNSSQSSISKKSLQNDNWSQSSSVAVQNNLVPEKTRPYMKYFIGLVVALVIATVIITISVCKKYCQEAHLAEGTREGPVCQDLNIVLSFWNDKLNISFQGKNEISVYQIDYEGNGASKKKKVLCKHGKGAFSISCGEEENNLCVPIPEFPKENSTTSLADYIYDIDKQCIQKKADLRWETSHRKISPRHHRKRRK